MVGEGEKLQEVEDKVGEVEDKVGVVEMLKGVGGEGEEEVEVLEESGVVMEVLSLPFPWLVPPPPQPQLSLPSPLPLPCLFLLLLHLHHCHHHYHYHHHYLLPSLLPLPPVSVPACSNKGPLPVQLQLFFGGHPARFPHVDLDPDLIRVPVTIVPPSLFWPLKQT